VGRKLSNIAIIKHGDPYIEAVLRIVKHMEISATAACEKEH